MPTVKTAPEDARDDPPFRYCWFTHGRGAIPPSPARSRHLLLLLLLLLLLPRCLQALLGRCLKTISAGPRTRPGSEADGTIEATARR